MMRLFSVVALTTLALFIAQVALASQLFLTYPEIDDTASWLAMRQVKIHCNTVAEDESDPTIAQGADAYVPGWEDKAVHWHLHMPQQYQLPTCKLPETVPIGLLPPPYMYMPLWFHHI
jgi:hypothetical protein